jgi:hypothetical protein
MNAFSFHIHIETQIHVTSMRTEVNSWLPNMQSNKAEIELSSVK